MQMPVNRTACVYGWVSYTFASEIYSIILQKLEKIAHKINEKIFDRVWFQQQNASFDREPYAEDQCWLTQHHLA